MLIAIHSVFSKIMDRIFVNNSHDISGCNIECDIVFTTPLVRHIAERRCAA